jgi:hypothetical protein
MSSRKNHGRINPIGGETGELNRSALIVTPKQPFLDWLHFVDPTSSDLTLQDLGKDPNIYLIPECKDDDQFANCLEQMHPSIFEDQLDGWWTDEAAWPKDRSLNSFQAWFDCRFYSMVIDLCDDPLVEH